MLQWREVVKGSCKSAPRTPFNPVFPRVMPITRVCDAAD